MNVNRNSIPQHAKQIKNGTIKHVIINIEIIISAKAIIVGMDLIICICENSQVFKKYC